MKKLASCIICFKRYLTEVCNNVKIDGTRNDCTVKENVLNHFIKICTNI